MRTFAILLLLCPLAPAQASGSVEPKNAEACYRKAWWLEHAKGDLEQALRQYLHALELDGPAKPKALSLLEAAIIQHRMDRHAEAEQLLARLFDEFSGETEIVADAKRRQAEWAQVDLRKNYTDWYRRYLFTPEVQTKILELVNRFGALPSDRDKKTNEDRKKLQQQILGYGVGAVPALRELAKAGWISGNSQLAERAARLVLQLGSLPPVGILLGGEDWAGDARVWATIFDLRREDRETLERACKKRGDAMARTLLAAASGPSAVLDLLRQDVGGVMAIEYEQATYALIEGLHAVRDEDVHARLIRLGDEAAAPIRIRYLIERVVTENGWRGATAADWLAWSLNRHRWEATRVGVSNAARLLRAGDGDTLDAMLDLIARSKVHRQLIEPMWEGLLRNGVPMQIPWTAARIRRVIELDSNEVDCEWARIFEHHRENAATWAMLLDTILSEPAKLEKCLTAHEVDLSRYFRCEDIGEVEGWLLEDGWGKAFAERFQRQWSNWSSEDKKAALFMIREGGALSMDRGFPKQLRAFLVQNKQDPDVGSDVVAALAFIDQNWTR